MSSCRPLAEWHILSVKELMLQSRPCCFRHKYDDILPDYLMKLPNQACHAGGGI